MDNNKSIDFTILDLNDLISKIQQGHIRKEDLAGTFDFLLKIYLCNYSQEFKIDALCGLSLIIKTYEIEPNMIKVASMLLSDVSQYEDMDLLLLSSKAYCELVHRHYHLIDDETASEIYNNVYKNYTDISDELLSEDGKEYKHDMFLTIGRMIELGMIPKDYKDTLYKEMYERFKSKKDIDALQLLNFFHAKKYIALDIFDDFLKLIGSLNNSCDNKILVQSIIRLVEHKLINQEDRMKTFDYLFQFLDHTDDMLKYEIIAGFAFLAKNQDIEEPQKTELMKKIQQLGEVQDPYMKQNIKTLEESLKQIRLPKAREKRKFERLNLRPEIPFIFPITLSFIAEDRLYKEYVVPLENIRQSIQLYYCQNALDFYSFYGNENLINKIDKTKELKLKISNEDQNDTDIRYLSCIMSNYIGFPDCLYTDERFKNDDLISYFQAVNIYHNNSNLFTRKNFRALLDKIKEFNNPDYVYPTLKLILMSFQNPIDFYVSYEEERALNKIVLESLSRNIDFHTDMLDIIIANARQNFLNINDAGIEMEHEILKDARIKMTYFTNQQLTIPEKNYEKIVVSNFLTGTRFTQRIDLSIKRLIKFRSHIVSVGLIKFGLNIASFDRMENYALNEFLVEKLTQEGYLDSGRNVNLDLKYLQRDKDDFISKCVCYTKEFIKADNLSENLINYTKFEKSIKDIIDGILNHRKEARELMQRFVLKDALALSFVIQKQQVKHSHEPYRDCFFPDDVNKEIRRALFNVTELALEMHKLFPKPKTLSVSGYKNAGTIAEKLIKLLCEDNKSLIIPTGMPIKPNKNESGHYFYILIKNCGIKNVKLIIVNGGDNLENAIAIDENFHEVDTKNAGNYLLCRETDNIDLDDMDHKTFLKEYIHRALLLPYTTIGDDSFSKKSLMDNINLISDTFTGFGFIKTKHKPTVLPENKRVYSMPSQLFGNCTTYNLQFALRFMFDWNEAQFTQFIHDSYLRYNSFLHSRVVDKSILKEDLKSTGGSSIAVEEIGDKGFVARIMNERKDGRVRAFSI